MEIQNSLDFVKVEQDLRTLILHNIKSKEFQKEALKVLDNIKKMNTQLSRFELEARRSASHSLRRVNEQVEQINSEIHKLEMWITMLMLS